jgi:hypothetical protein
MPRAGPLIRPVPPCPRCPAGEPLRAVHLAPSPQGGVGVGARRSPARREGHCRRRSRPRRWPDAGLQLHPAPAAAPAAAACPPQIIAEDAASSEVLEADEWERATQDSIHYAQEVVSQAVDRAAAQVRRLPAAWRRAERSVLEGAAGGSPLEARAHSCSPSTRLCRRWTRLASPSPPCRQKAAPRVRAPPNQPPIRLCHAIASALHTFSAVEAAVPLAHAPARVSMCPGSSRAPHLRWHHQRRGTPGLYGPTALSSVP